MNKWRYFAGGAVAAGAGMAALLLGLPGVQAKGGVVAIRAVDYGYQGVPGTVPAGEVRLSFTNASEAEGHEVSLFRINDGVSASLDQILAEDETHRAQEAQQSQQAQAQAQQGDQNPPAEQAPPPPKMTFFANSGAAPGESAKLDLIGKLPAGRYGIVCFLPVAGDEGGSPHYKKGMKAEFTVK